MPSATSFKSKLLYAVAAISVGGFFTIPGVSQENEDSAEPVELKELPERFFQIQDANGFFWQAFGNGALTSGETQYLQSGLNLLVDGDAFAPTTGSMLEPNGEGIISIELSESRDSLVVTRNLFFDRDRSAVRVLDTVRNTSGKAVTFTVQERTTYPFGWQSLHDQDGALLSSDPVLKIGEEDSGMVVHFSAAEGRHDTLLLFGAKGEVIPKLSASSNRRELTLSYEVEIPAGESRSILHWISQVGIPELSEAQLAFAAFQQGAQLLGAEVSPDLAEQIVNFPAEAFPVKSPVPTQLRSLVALNEFLDGVGVHRRGADLLWMSRSSQISGSVKAEGVLRVVSSPGGEREVAISDVAAIRGGLGASRPVRIFLRDGQVFSGTVSAEGFGILPAESEEFRALDFESLNLLLLKTGVDDGIAPKGAIGFLQLLDGSVVAFTDEKIMLPAVAPWGKVVLPMQAVVEMKYVSRPVPSYRVVKEDGSRFTVFLINQPISFSVAGIGPVEISGSEIDQFWKAGQSVTTIESVEESWLDFAEAPGDNLPSQGFLLRGNNILAGGFGDSSLTLRSEGTVIRVETERIRMLRRSFEVTPGADLSYVVELKNGESVEGVILDDFVTVENGDEKIVVAVETLLAFRSLDS